MKKFMLGSIFAAFMMFALAGYAVQGGPAYVSISPHPTEGAACKGDRVQIQNTDGKMWCCVSNLWTACGSVPVTPGGANTNIQFNDGGTLGGDSKLTFDKSTGALLVAAPRGAALEIGNQADILNPAVCNATDCYPYLLFNGEDWGNYLRQTALRSGPVDGVTFETLRSDDGSPGMMLNLRSLSGAYSQAGISLEPNGVSATSPDYWQTSVRANGGVGSHTLYVGEGADSISLAVPTTAPKMTLTGDMGALVLTDSPGWNDTPNVVFTGGGAALRHLGPASDNPGFELRCDATSAQGCALWLSPDGMMSMPWVELSASGSTTNSMFRLLLGNGSITSTITASVQQPISYMSTDVGHTFDGTVTVKKLIHNNSATAAPTCDATTRGMTYFTQGAAGVKDKFEVCAKDAGDAYAWRTLY